MRVHEKEREEYARLKKRLAQKFPYDIESYCDGKDAFVRAMEERALAEYDGIWDRLYLAARKVQHPREVSPFIEAGGVAAALVTERGSIYVGMFSGNVRGEKCNRKYDHKRGKPYPKDCCGHGRRKARHALRRLP